MTKKILALFLLTPALLLGLSGCHQSQQLTNVTGLIFERGSGSVWGNQLYISITPTQITTLRYIPQGSSELQTLENIPITPQQWQQITQLLQQLELKQEKTSWLEKLFPRQDGSDYRRLTLIYAGQEIAYGWPEDAQALEVLLDQLVLEVTA